FALAQNTFGDALDALRSRCPDHIDFPDWKYCLLCLLRGRPVVALTADSAAIECPNGGVLTYCRYHRPALVVVADPVTGHFEMRELSFKELAPASPDVVARNGFRIAFEA